MFELHTRRRSALQTRISPPTAWTETSRAPEISPVHLIDTTMLFAPRSGGVKRYLLAKRAWFAEHRPGVSHTLVVPGASTRMSGKGVFTVAAARLPFADGYRWPASTKKWADQLVALRPDLIEAGDPYGPGRAALDAGERLGGGYHLLLIGAGSGAKPQANATFLDFQRDPHEMARLLASCDAFLHANDREAFGLVVLEAMASGLPVIGVGAGGVSEMVDEGVGQLAPRPTSDALAEAVEAVFSRDVTAMSVEARRRAVALHGWSRTFSSLSGLYGELTGQPLAPHAPYLRLARTR